MKNARARQWAAVMLLPLFLIAAGGCGKKGKLRPRDQLPYTDEELPPEWRESAPPPAGELGVDGLLEKAGDPARIRERNLTPEPEAAAEDEDRQGGDQNEESEANE